MEERILDKLKKIEKKHNISILYACESGSRAWGFPSMNSDFDVRFIYLKPLSAYLSIHDPDLHLTFPIDEILDIGGWDLKKTLQLIKKSNTTPFEWIQSPIVYHEEIGFKDELWEICKHYFNKRSNIFHYLGIAKGVLDTVNENEQIKIKIKKLFYILRSLLAAQWCMEKNEIAPMDIGKLMGILPEYLKIEMSYLIELKRKVEESYKITITTDVKQYINEIFTKCTEFANAVDPIIFEKEMLDRYFIKKLGVEY